MYSVLTTTYTTNVETITEYTRTTPGTTVIETVSAGAAIVKRNGDSDLLPRAALGRSEAFRSFRRQTNNTDGDSAMAASFSSACSCHDYDGEQVTTTYTDFTIVRIDIVLSPPPANDHAGQNGQSIRQSRSHHNADTGCWGRCYDDNNNDSGWRYYKLSRRHDRRCSDLGGSQHDCLRHAKQPDADCSTFHLPAR